MRRAVFLFVVLLVAGHALAQSATPAEISFWESVRNSKNPAELQAYIDQYPNGSFVVLAKARLAALSPKPAAPAAQPPRAPAAVTANTPPSAVTRATRMPQVGDTWTYRLSYPRQWGQRDRPPSTYVVSVEGLSEGTITDRVSIDGGTPSNVAHTRELTLATQQVVSLFSPYLVALRDLPARGSLGTVTIQDAPCKNQYGCRASAKVLGTETVTVPAGKFTAQKILVDETWWPASAGVGNATLGRMNGGRTLTVWYVPELKRAVKFASRITVGDVPPIEPSFDLELVSHQLK